MEDYPHSTDAKLVDSQVVEKCLANWSSHPGDGSCWKSLSVSTLPFCAQIEPGVESMHRVPTLPTPN